MSLTETKAHQHLCAGAEAVKSVHLRTLLNDEKRQDALFIEAEGISIIFLITCASISLSMQALWPISPVKSYAWKTLTTYWH